MSYANYFGRNIPILHLQTIHVNVHLHYLLLLSITLYCFSSLCIFWYCLLSTHISRFLIHHFWHEKMCQKLHYEMEIACKLLLVKEEAEK